MSEAKRRERRAEKFCELDALDFALRRSLKASEDSYALDRLLKGYSELYGPPPRCEDVPLSPPSSQSVSSSLSRVPVSQATSSAGSLPLQDTTQRTAPSTSSGARDTRTVRRVGMRRGRRRRGC